MMDDRLRQRFAVAKARLEDELSSVVAELARDLARKRTYWVGGDPTESYTQDDHFVVWNGAGGKTPGAWKNMYTGAAGDVLGLVAHLLRCTPMDALRWAEDRYGLARMSEADRKALEDKARVKRETQRVKQAQDRARAVAGAVRMFERAQPSLFGTAAEAYLASRGISLARVPNIEPDTFRFAPAAEWWLGAEHEGGRKVRSGPTYPAIVSAMRDGLGLLKAVHFTFLAEDGSGKAKLPKGKPNKPKLMWPETAGLCIRVSRGSSGLSWEEAAAHGVLDTAAYGEGVEDGLSIAIADADLRVSAAGSLPNLLSAPIPPSADGAILFKDNDWGKPQAEAQFETARARFAAAVPTVVASSHFGKDMNDLLKGK